MSVYKSFAIAGLGNLGIFLVEEFLKAKKAGIINAIVLLTLAGSTNTHATEFEEKGVKVFRVDYYDQAALTNALAGVDVLISTVPNSALGLQLPLAEAAHAAGVQIFVPSEFGKTTEGATDGPLFLTKSRLHAKLRNIGIAYTLFFTGVWPDYCFQIPLLDIDVTSGKVRIGGDGNTQMTLTGRRDVARFVVHVFTHLPPPELVNKAFTIEGDHKSFNELFEGYEAKTGKKLIIEYVPVEQLEEEIKQKPDPENWAAVFHHHIATGGMLLRPLSNDKFPEWNPKSAVDYVVEAA